MAKLSDLGERKVVKMLLELFDQGEDVGLGDDAAAIPVDDHYLLLTTDVVNQRTHIPEGAKPEQVGWYVVAVNFSDIAAMGGEPTGFMAALSVPRTLDVEYLEGLGKGMKTCVTKYGARILGGDTKEGPEVSICGTALGRTRGRRVLRRTGCNPGDLVALTGALGRAGGALRTAESGRLSKEAMDALLRVRPRLSEGLILAESPHVTACMDISDGLSSTLDQISALNGVSFRVNFDEIPAAPSLAGADRGTREAAILHDGGDFELLFTVQKSGLESLMEQFDREDVSLTAIGEVTQLGENIVVDQGGERRLEARGYEHFR